jgi:hypothetical protein
MTFCYLIVDEGNARVLYLYPQRSARVEPDEPSRAKSAHCMTRRPDMQGCVAGLFCVLVGAGLFAGVI